MLEDGTIPPSCRLQPMGQPHPYGTKKSSDWRIVGDYSNLNLKTKRDNYPLPYLNDFSIKLYDHNYISCIDLKDAFHQIPIVPEDIEKSDLVTSFGSFEFTRRSFGLFRAAQTFQRFIDSALRNLTVN